MDTLSVLVLARDSHTETLSSVSDIVQRLKDQHEVRSDETEILLLDLAGKIQESDVNDILRVTLLPCKGMHPGEARNLALIQAKGSLLCFIDANCVPSEGWLDSLLEPFRDEQIVGVKGSYTLPRSNLVSRFVQIETEVRHRRLRALPTIDFVDMYSAAYRRSVLLANGGFDGRFGGLEEQELAYRLAGRGYKMIFQPDAHVHLGHPIRLVDYLRSKAITGYWKAQVIRLYPDRGFSDSYTPQALKFQIGTLLLAGLMLLLAPFSDWFLLGLVLALVAFNLSMLPFLVLVWREDPPIVLITIPMLVGRALSLGAGYLWGILRPSPRLAERTSRIAGTTYLAKRLVDILGSIAGLSITVLLMPVLALLIKVSSPGPILFRQTRVGRGGQPFVLFKFRTMEVGAEDRLLELVDLQSLEQPAFKLLDDPRITGIGRLLRRWSLDELPQFWNVLLGEMSLVGPRPEETRFVALYSDWHRRRLAVKPGMTGPMQIKGRGDLSLDQRVELEIAYIDEYTLWQDMKILVKTIPSVLKGEGAR